MSTANTSRGLLLTVGATFGAAGFLTSYKVAASLGSTSDAVLFMLTSAAVLNSVTSVVQNRGARALAFDRLSVLLSVALAGFTLVGNHLAVEAVARISAPLTSVMQQTQVLFVASLSDLFLRESISPRFWVGAAIALGGLFLLHLPAGGSVAVDAVGTVMAVGSAACFAGMALLTRKYIHRIQPIAVNALRLWLSIALWGALERRVPEAPSWVFVACCAAAAFFGPFLSRAALMYALRYIPPSTTTLVGLITPLVTLLPSFLVFGDVPSAQELAGGAVMIAGIALPLLEMRARAVAAESARA